jgi:hypothetical protein
MGACQAERNPKVSASVPEDETQRSLVSNFWATDSEDGEPEFVARDYAKGIEKRIASKLDIR